MANFKVSRYVFQSGMQSKSSFKGNDVVSLNSKENANRFCRFFSNLAETACPKSKFGIKTTEYNKQIRNEYEDFALQNVDTTTVDKILKNLDVDTASGIDQICSKFFIYCFPVIVIHLINIINLSIKLDTFPSKCKITQLNWSKNEMKTETKYTDQLIFYLQYQR